MLSSSLVRILAFTAVVGAPMALASDVAAQATPPAPPRPTCTSAEHRQFDFWVGDWVVKGANGNVLGENRIERALDGCTIVENWTGAGAGRGISLNFYDRSSGRWSQVWIDNSGQPLRLTGGMRDGRMVLESQAAPGDTSAARQRITWTPMPNRTVRQHWESSSDRGATWTSAFDGLYVRKSP